MHCILDFYILKTDSSLKLHLSILYFPLRHAIEGQLEQVYKSCLLIFDDYNVQMKKKMVEFHLNSLLRSVIHLSVAETWFCFE